MGGAGARGRRASPRRDTQALQRAERVVRSAICRVDPANASVVTAPTPSATSSAAPAPAPAPAPSAVDEPFRAVTLPPPSPSAIDTTDGANPSADQKLIQCGPVDTEYIPASVAFSTCTFITARSSNLTSEKFVSGKGGDATAYPAPNATIFANQIHYNANAEPYQEPEVEASVSRSTQMLFAMGQILSISSSPIVSNSASSSEPARRAPHPARATPYPPDALKARAPPTRPTGSTASTPPSPTRSAYGSVCAWLRGSSRCAAGTRQVSVPRRLRHRRHEHHLRRRQMAPWSTTGGLGDVLGGFPPAWSRMGPTGWLGRHTLLKPHQRHHRHLHFQRILRVSKALDTSQTNFVIVVIASHFSMPVGHSFDMKLMACITLKLPSWFSDMVITICKFCISLLLPQLKTIVPVSVIVTVSTTTCSDQLKHGGHQFDSNSLSHGFRISFWGKFCDAVGQQLQLCTSGSNSILSLKGVRMSDSKGRSVVTISTTQLQVNPDFPVVARLNQCDITEGMNIGCNSLPREISTMHGNHVLKTIAQIKDEKLGRSDKHDFITVQAVLSHVRADILCYQACSLELNGKPCYIKVMRNDDETWYCDSCNQHTEGCEFRYLLLCQIKDHTGTTCATAFQEAGASPALVCILGAQLIVSSKS
ncbi:unnamed protein product [Miscanthus lutarioriparius]|uniref:Replication factor A C-terminal domain-containing protein n=1 Tax=Miscanthus lutarioriparius TaxID=422564 RepID=A0A811P0T2_9POAL|nr:unnamed protein product [Miscanthus lutarioriparius]